MNRNNSNVAPEEIKQADARLALYKAGQAHVE
jgi:hypothetical protein